MKLIGFGSDGIGGKRLGAVGTVPGLRHGSPGSRHRDPVRGGPGLGGRAPELLLPHLLCGARGSCSAIMRVWI